MNKTVILSAVCGAFLSTTASAAVLDRIDATNDAGNFWVPSLGQELDSPYYRANGEDWGWTHNPIATAFTTATLSVSAYDVDAPSEVDEIWVKDEGVMVLLGTLEGSNNAFSFTSFNLGANLFNEVASGLEVFMKIDTGDDGWLVSLSNSTLTTDGRDPGNPNPVVPLPAAGWLMMASLGGLAAMRRKK